MIIFKAAWWLFVSYFCAYITYLLIFLFKNYIYENSYFKAGEKNLQYSTLYSLDRSNMNFPANDMMVVKSVIRIQYPAYISNKVLSRMMWRISYKRKCKLVQVGLVIVILYRFVKFPPSSQTIRTIFSLFY